MVFDASLNGLFLDRKYHPSPILEKFDLATGGVSSLSQLSIYFHIGEKKKELSPGALTLLLANQECHRKGRIQLAKPLSAHQHHCMTWEDSQTFFSQEISFLARSVFKWVLCHFSVADSNPFGSQT